MHDEVWRRVAQSGELALRRRSGCGAVKGPPKGGTTKRGDEVWGLRFSKPDVRLADFRGEIWGVLLVIEDGQAAGADEASSVPDLDAF